MLLSLRASFCDLVLFGFLKLDIEQDEANLNVWWNKAPGKMTYPMDENNKVLFSRLHWNLKDLIILMG